MFSDETPCDEYSRWRGSLQLVYSEDATNEVVTLAVMNFKTKAEMDVVWAMIPRYECKDAEPFCMMDYILPSGEV